MTSHVQTQHGVTTERIWELLSARLRGFLISRVSDPQLAEDLLQETFIRIHRRLDGLTDRERLTPWVFQIARNLVTDHFRARGPTADEGLDETSLGLAYIEDDEPVNLNELVSGWLPGMISELPETYREAVELYELRGMPQKEIAERLGLSLSGTKSRVQRGRALLKQRLLECCSFEHDRRGNLVAVSPNVQPCDDC